MTESVDPITMPSDPRVRRVDAIGWTVGVERLIDESRGYLTIEAGTVREFAFVREAWSIRDALDDGRSICRALWLPDGSISRVPRHKSWSNWADVDAIPADLQLDALRPFERGELVFGGWSKFDFVYEVPRDAALTPRFVSLIMKLHEHDR